MSDGLRDLMPDLGGDEMSIQKESKVVQFPNSLKHDGYDANGVYNVQLDMKRWALIGGDFYLETDSGWKPRKGTEFDINFGKKQRNAITSYYSFFLGPSHDNYVPMKVSNNGKEVNFYRRLNRPTEKGELKAHWKVLGHLGSQEHKGMQILLDWICIKYRTPKRPIPMIMFMGGKGAGKSTWENILDGLLEDNFYPGHASEILTKDNIHTYGKAVVHLREKIAGGKFGDNEMMRFKTMISSRTSTFKALYHDRVVGENFTAYTLDSNDINTPIAMEAENRRFMGFDVPKLSEEVKYRGIFDELKAEAPAFAYYLLHEHVLDEELGCEKNDLWFYEKVIHTKASQRVQQYSKNAESLDVDEYAGYIQEMVDKAKEDYKDKITTLVISKTEAKKWVKNKEERPNTVLLNTALLDSSTSKRSTDLRKGEGRYYYENGQAVQIKGKVAGFHFDLS